jgi:NAD(P)-dependent dehydrogenase (short-subunit alcohol dehydrogenase family)
MLGRGRSGKDCSIILIGSPTGLNGEGAEFTAYSSMKAGIHGMARTVAAAYAADGIRVYGDAVIWSLEVTTSWQRGSSPGPCSSSSGISSAVC